MKKTFFKILLSIITMQLVVNTALALELDMSVDEEIRKNMTPQNLKIQYYHRYPKSTTHKTKQHQ